MILKKICMLGATSVGKTSLVARFVQSLFSEEYLTTVGVKIDKKVVATESGEVTLMVWDLAGDDDFQKLQMTYLRGAAGYLLVADGTRPASVRRAIELQGRVQAALGTVPFILALNKADLSDQWAVSELQMAQWASQGWTIRKTSARTGQGVEESFRGLANKMVPT